MDKEKEITNVDTKTILVRMTVNPEENAHFRFSKAPILYKRYIAIDTVSIPHGAILQLLQAITAALLHENIHYNQYSDTLSIIAVTACGDCSFPS